MEEKLKELGFKYTGETDSYCYNVYYNYEKDILIYESKGVFEFADSGIVIESIEDILNIL